MTAAALLIAVTLPYGAADVPAAIRTAEQHLRVTEDRIFEHCRVNFHFEKCYQYRIKELELRVLLAELRRKL